MGNQGEMIGERDEIMDGGHPPAQDCADARAHFGDYLDGTLSGLAMQALSSHFAGCSLCHEEFRAQRAVQQALSALRPMRAPERLQGRLLSALAIERERGTHLNLMNRIRRDWSVSLAPFVLRATGGFAAAVVLLGSAALFLADNLPVQASDEHMAHLNSPRYLYSAVPQLPIDRQDGVLVDAKVDEQGRVYDYNLIAGQIDPVSRLRVEQNLLNSVFKPATVFGSPVRGHVMVTFSAVSVRG